MDVVVARRSLTETMGFPGDLDHGTRRGASGGKFLWCWVCAGEEFWYASGIVMQYYMEVRFDH